MYKKQHGVLFTALTLVLGIALLATTLAAPRLRLAEGLEWRQVRGGSVSNEADAVEQSISAASAGSAAAGTQAGVEAQLPAALQSPARIVVQAPVNINDPAIYKSPNPHKIGVIWEHGKDADNVPDGDPAALARTNWEHIEYLDIFSTMKPARDKVTLHPEIKDKFGRVDAYAPATIIVPGSYGSYRFTVESPLTDVAYDLELSKGTEIVDQDRWKDFPIRCRLWDITDGTAKPIDTSDDGNSNDIAGDWEGWPLEFPVGGEKLTKVCDRPLPKGQSHTYQLDWKWDFELMTNNGADPDRDKEDTSLGEGVRDPNGAPHYQVKLRLLMWADSIKFMVCFEVDPFDEGFDAIVTPTNREYEFQELLMPREGDTGVWPLPIPARTGYIFVGWSYDKRGDDMVQPGDAVEGDMVLYAIWTEVIPDTRYPWWLLLIPPILAAPLIPLIKLASLLPLAAIPPILWLLLKPERTSVNPLPPVYPPVGSPLPPPKTGDSSAAIWSALAMLALSGSLAFVLSRKRREEED